MKIGIGYDVHKLVPDRALILGGVDIPFDKGLDGHSDADVLCHAIGDAILGAAKMGDIGQHFPDTDPKYKGANSLKLLEKINQIVNDKGFTVNNVDSVVIAQAPKLSSHRQEMRENIANALNVTVDCVGVKATTTERLGFEGRGEGISAQAVALLTEE